MTTKRTKIVCTLGPSTQDDETLRAMIRAGMNVARLNFSHGDHKSHRANIERVRRIADELGANVAIMVDTKGPEIRTGLLKDHKPVILIGGTKTTITTEPIEGTAERFCLDYATLPQDVSPGSTIFIDDGLICLEVEHVEDTNIHCRILNGGLLGERKGVNVPNLQLSIPAVTEQDKRDVEFSCRMNVDAIAASFINDEHGIREIRALCKEFGAPTMPIIAKIESALAVRNFEKIMAESDGIMIARGDLGVEISPARVPNVQKQIIRTCNENYCPVITATQMLESMTYHPRPTRAEVTDVANAIYDGTDCVMLSGETAAGKYPLEAVRMMTEICEQAEPNLLMRESYYQHLGSRGISSVTGFGAVQMAKLAGAKAILCPTSSGRTACIMSAFRPKLPIIATSPLPTTVRRTCFFWGVMGLLTAEQSGLTATCYDALKTARAAGCVQEDDIVVITAGDPLSSPFTSCGYETDTNVCMIAQVL